ncbi:MAG: ATP-binding cassette domain-containing protein [Oscillospiraceae bacterium]|nr:ATP-binding cassette domain-containing protein [Oscillospiraceae bacterium]
MIEIRNLSKTFTTKSGDVEALKNISLTIPDGEIYGIIGMSGAGKSTLVRCINMLERPTEGSIIIDGKNLNDLSEAELRQERQKITMIFQDFNLLMQRNCLKNVCFPLELAGVKKSEAVRRAMELLDMVGLADKAKNYPAQLSGGQQQRVAIARALATHPKILLCDEATSALDPQTTHSILSLIRDVRDQLGLTVIVITHQMSVVEEICGRVAILNGGEVAEEGVVNEVFSAPKSEAAKRLVYPDGFSTDTLSPSSDEHFIRVVYNGAEVSKTPLIAQMAMDKNIPASIRSASTRSIGGKAYGNMLLSVTGDESLAEEAISYLREIPDIIAEEVKTNA